MCADSGCAAGAAAEAGGAAVLFVMSAKGVGAGSALGLLLRLPCAASQASSSLPSSDTTTALRRARAERSTLRAPSTPPGLLLAEEELESEACCWCWCVGGERAERERMLLSASPSSQLSSVSVQDGGWLRLLLLAWQSADCMLPLEEAGCALRCWKLLSTLTLRVVTGWSPLLLSGVANSRQVPLLAETREHEAGPTAGRGA